jgi:ornithine cyclodeaminase/alanine dehydrogenase-like protein (mu-crystallin family)
LRIKILDTNDVKKSIQMGQVIAAVKEAFIQLSEGQAVVPLRSQVPVNRKNGMALFMPAYLQESHSLGAKIVSVFPENASLGLPTIHAVVVVLDADTGRPQAVMDGTLLTALRTGAASGLATDLLARGEAKIAAVFGAGTQGRTQLEAVCTVRAIERAWIYDPDRKLAQPYAEEMSGRGTPFPQDVRVADSPRQAVSEADVICAATTSFQPVFDDADLKPGVHINGVGSYTPEMQEIPAETVIRAKVFVDSVSAAWEEAGDLILPVQKGLVERSHIQGEIGQLAAGRIQGRTGKAEITFFKSVGVAVQDVSVARKILTSALDLNLGKDVEL